MTEVGSRVPKVKNVKRFLKKGLSFLFSLILILLKNQTKNENKKKYFFEYGISSDNASNLIFPDREG
jgi:hypothetical protein